MAKGKVGTDYLFTFGVKSGSGAPRTGLATGDFAINIRNPANSASQGTPVAIIEIGGGQYRFSILGTFTTANGAGEYGVDVELTTAPVDFFATTVEFHLRDLDDLAQPGDAMDLVADAVDAAAIATDAIDADAIAAGAIGVSEAPNLDVAVSSRATQAQILTDATPFPGANIDAAISSRESEASAATRAATNQTEHDATQALIAALNDLSAAAAADAVWDEDIVAAHGTADTGGLLLRVLGALISTRTNNATLNALLGVPDSAGEDVPSEVDTVLTAAHGAGAWTSLASTDWTTAERNQIRDRLGIDGVSASPTAIPTVFVDGAFDLVDGVETGITLRLLLRALGATLAGDAPAPGEPQVADFRAIGNPGTVRVTSAADANGARTIVLTLT